MAKTRARRNSNAPGVFHSWAKRWRGNRKCRCSICKGRTRPGSRKAQRDAAINDSRG